jgi:hypothetical protein
MAVVRDRCEDADREIAVAFVTTCERDAIGGYGSRFDAMELEEQITRQVLAIRGIPIEEYGAWVERQIEMANRQIDAED